MTEFKIRKLTGTHADVLGAVGLAEALSPLGRVMIEDVGAEYRITLPIGIGDRDMRIIGHSAGFKYLVPKANQKAPSSLHEIEIFDYSREKDKAARYRTARQQARKTGTTIPADIEQDAPHRDWPLYRSLNVLQGYSGTNKVVEAIRSETREGWRTKLYKSLMALPGSADVFEWPISLVQVFNPQAAKGYARLKPDSTDRNDKTKDAWADPFLEWLRYRGYFAAACPFTIGDDMRLLCPEPQRISFPLFHAVVSDLRSLNIFSSAVKVDCIATLRLALLLIERSPEFNHGFQKPNDLISGMFIVQYQSMGNAKAITRMERLALPGWFDLATQADAEIWREILKEQERIVRSLDDTHSDEIGMLLQYRRFLESRRASALSVFLNFLEQYGTFLIRERGRDQQWRHRQFQTRHLEKMMEQQPDYRTILENPGFKAVASAIRTATVSAQVRKRNNQDYREIRYDLLPELRRKRALPGVEPFVSAVSEFVSAYNAESARRLEMKKESGIRRISTDDFVSFVELFRGCRDASLIGSMLCAFATCKHPKAGEEPVVGEENTPEESSNA